MTIASLIEELRRETAYALEAEADGHGLIVERSIGRCEAIIADIRLLMAREVKDYAGQ